jgi:trk system potassium uptake protein TrkH
MSDLRSLGHVIGILLASLGVIMLLPLAADLIAGNGQWPIFAFSAAVTAAFGLIVAISSASQATQTLTRRQSFLLTTLVWLVLPLFGALPMMLGPSGLTFTDAFFEAMSGFTTTGSTILTGIDALPEGIKLWRGLMQWIVPARNAGRRHADVPLRRL